MKESDASSEESEDESSDSSGVEEDAHDSSQSWRMCQVCSNRMIHKTQHTNALPVVHCVDNKTCVTPHKKMRNPVQLFLARWLSSAGCTCTGHAHVYTVTHRISM